MASSTAGSPPVTTAPWVAPCASRTDVVRHEPPGRSTNSTAGRPPIARMRRSVSAPESQPSFDTGTSASLTPVIAATAASSAWATAACVTITPRSGSLIVFLEVLLQLASLRHALQQALVELPRRVDAAVALQMVHRHHLADHGEILARVERHGDERQAHAEQRRRLAVEPRAVVLPGRVPVLELHDHLDALLLAHGAHAEQRLDVDQPDAPDLHVVLIDIKALFGDRKSTRLNSSHGYISYAVFCLKKKKKKQKERYIQHVM